MRLDRHQLIVLGRRLGSAAENRRLRRPIDVGVDQPDLLARSRQRHREIGSDPTSGWGGGLRASFTANKGPGGPSGGGDGAPGGYPPSDDQGGGPWGEPSGRPRRTLGGGSAASPLDEFLRRSRARFGGGGG